jgi:hypothetical protein
MEASRVDVLRVFQLRLRLWLTLDDVAVSSCEGFVGDREREEQE